MTTTESIQMNIHYTKVKLNNARKVICKDEIEQLNIQGAIDFYLNELKDLKFSLKCSTKNN